MGKKQILAGLNFPEPFPVRNRSSIAGIIKPGKRCGIYILHFSNGDCYVGQAKDVTRRYVQHCQTFPDIQQISFKTVSEQKLDIEEIRIIETLEREEFPLRNIQYTSIFRGDSKFDEIMTPEDQEKWLTDLSYIDQLGPRRDLSELYRKTDRAYQRFRKHPDADPIFELLCAYIPLAIPAYKRTEGEYWSMTSPKKSTPIRINIQWQEVFAVIPVGDQWLAIFQLAKSPLDRRPRMERIRFRMRHRSAWRCNHNHQPGGQDQTRFEVPLDKTLKFIQEPVVMSAIRLMNFRLMRKGMVNYRRSHTVKLADEIFDAIACA